MDVFIQLLGYFLTPIVGVVSWFASRRVRNNDMLNKMQETIDMLVEKNSQLIEDITKLREENAELKAGQDDLLRQLNKLKNGSCVEKKHYVRKSVKEVK